MSTMAEIEVDERDIFKFSQDFPEGSGQGIPNHYHICVKVADSYMVFNCCTSQSGKVQDRIRFFGRTYTEVTNSRKSGFNVPTFVDCDNVYTISNEDFGRYIDEGKVCLSGILSKTDYSKIVQGILNSDMVEDNIKKLFNADDASEG